MRPMQQLADVDSDQGRRHESEIGQGGIATADVRGVQEGAAKSSLPGEPSERCIGVGNGDELCAPAARLRSEEHTSELQSRLHLVCRLLLEKKKNMTRIKMM